MALRLCTPHVHSYTVDIFPSKSIIISSVGHGYKAPIDTEMDFLKCCFRYFVYRHVTKTVLANQTNKR